MADIPENASEAAETVQTVIEETANAARVEGAEIAQSEAGDAIAAAQADRERAERVASDIAAAAINTELGRRLENLQQEQTTWRTAMETRLAETQQQMTAALDRLTPPPSSVPAGTPTTPAPPAPLPPTVAPENVSAGDPPALPNPPEAARPKVRRHFR